VGGSPFVCDIIEIIAIFVLSPAFAGLNLVILGPGACAPGFMLVPAPQAKTRTLRETLP
jgi:hypothetical protein